MALKVLLLRNKIDAKTKSLEKLREKDGEFEKREAELEAAIAEMTEETTDEERAVVEAQAEAFAAEKESHLEAKAGLEAEIAEIEKEIRGEEERQRANVFKEEEKRGDYSAMESRKFFRMSAQERDAFFVREDVKAFLGGVRSLAGNKRSVTGGELVIPTVILGILRENVIDYSKLYKHVNVRSVAGNARQVVMGTIPEAVWTEACAALNEINFTFTSVEVDSYKVGGFVPVCNSLLEDTEANNLALAEEIIVGMLQAIGLALDKAILYGTDNKMPMGIVTNLVASYNESNVIAITGKTDTALFKALVEASGAAKGAYSRGRKFWAMNEATYTKLIANSLSLNAAGAISAGIDRTMPLIGGAIEVLNFIPDDTIIGGYGDLYLLAERGEARVSQSEHAQFVQDNTVFKGVARYDGAPVIGDAFVAIGINGVAPTATMSFAPDTTNAG